MDYTLSAGSALLAALSEHLVRRLPEYDQIGVIVLGRLAIDQQFRGQGLGEVLLLAALEHSLRLRMTELSADALHDAAKRFSEKYDHCLPRPSHEAVPSHELDSRPRVVAKPKRAKTSRSATFGEALNRTCLAGVLPERLPGWGVNHRVTCGGLADGSFGCTPRLPRVVLMRVGVDVPGACIALKLRDRVNDPQTVSPTS